MIKERRRCGACEVLSGGTGYIDTACTACGYESCLAHVDGHQCKTAEQPATAAQPAEAKAYYNAETGYCLVCKTLREYDHTHGEPSAPKPVANPCGCRPGMELCYRCFQPVSQPKRAHDFSDPYVRDSSKRIVCVSCGFPPGWSGACDARDWRARYEANINTDGVTNVLDTPSIPERIDRRLSHVGGMHDEDLVGR